MEYKDFEEYLESEYKHLAMDFFECNGGHVWRIDDIEKEYINICQEKSARDKG